MRQSSQLGGSFGTAVSDPGPGIGVRDDLERPPDESLHAGDAAVIPRSPLFPRSQEHQVQPQRVRPISLHQRVRADLGTPTLAHLGAFCGEDHALVAELAERFSVIHQTQISQNLGEEASV